jgi:hypothetical protein
VDQIEEVLPQPGDANELGAMCCLVKGDPHPKLRGPKLLLPLEHQHVGAHQCHHVSFVFVVRKDQLVLAEHPFGENAQECAGLHGHHPASQGRRRPTTTGFFQAGGDLLFNGREHARKAADIASSPLTASNHL